MTHIVIDGRDFAYSLRPADGTYEFHISGGTYRFRQWTWGEKNRVTDASTVLDPDTGRLRIDIALFNELLLASTLVESDALASITPESVRELNPVLGDTLLSLAYWVNEVPVEDKKSDARGAAGAAYAPVPDDLQTLPGVRLDARPGRSTASGRYRDIRADSGRAGASVGAGAGR